LASPGWAAAQQELRVPAVEVEDTRLGDQPAPTEVTPFVTVIDVRGAEERVRSLAETLAESAGTSVRSLGGLGAYSAVSIRGSSSAEVAVFLDGVPMSRGMLGSVDLSVLPLDALDRIEVYRGQAPPELGGQAIGGAINLVTRRERGAAATSASLSLGSFGTRKIDLYRAARPGTGIWEYSAFLSYLGSEGDFSFRNGNGTTQNPADDFTDQRQNNDFNQIDAHAAVVRHGAGGDQLRVAGHSFWKDQGVPGTDHATVTAAHLSTLRAGVDPKAWSGRLGAYALAERRHFTDPIASEFGGVMDLTDWSEAGGASVRLARALGTHHLVALTPELAAEHFAESDEVSPQRSPHALRVQGALTAADSIALFGDALLIEPAVRIDAYRTTGPRASLAPPMPEGADLARADVVPSPRLGVGWRTPLRDLSAKANLGRYFRLPSFYDLYANLGYFVGRPDLVPEQSLNWDLGLLWERRGAGRWARVLVEADYFESRTDDLIVYTPGFRFTSPINAGSTPPRGLESALALATAPAAPTANYTFLDLRYHDTDMH